MLPSGLDYNNLKIVDPLNTVTTLNFKEIRNEIDKASPKNQSLRQSEAQKIEEKRSKNEQQHNQAAHTSNKIAGTNGI